MRLVGAEARMGPGGAMLAAVAAATAAAGLMSPPGGGVAMLAQWGGSLLLVLCLCRVAMPHLPRVALIAMLMGVALGDAAGADPVRADATGRDIDRRIGDAEAAAARAAAAAHGRDSLLTGAHITIEGRWGGRIAAALDRQIGGAAAAPLSITGRSADRSDDTEARTILDWSIARAGQRTTCGSTTIAGPRSAAIVDAARFSFARAIDASLARGIAACA